MRILLKIVITGLAVWISTIIPGIDLDTDSFWGKVGTLLAVALIFGIINAVLKPLATLLGLPFILLTLGLFFLVINALLYWLTGAISSALDLPFSVSGFWAAFFGAIIVTVVSWVLNISAATVED